MPAQTLTIRPGINTQATPMLNEGGWSFSQFVRFFEGYLQKLGGWVKYIDTPLTGTARAMLEWEDASQNQYVIFGSELALQVMLNGNLYTITPIAGTDDVTPSFTTTLSSSIVEVTDTASIAAAGNYVNILNPISVGGLILEGPYLITDIVDANNYHIDAGQLATAGATNTGTAAEFTTVMTSSSVKVTLADHGLSPGDVYAVFIPTTVGGLTLSGTFNVATVIDSANFTILDAPAVSSGSAFENGGNVRLQYYIPSGNLSGATQGGEYGAGNYGGGRYGAGDSATFVPARVWSFGYWGTDVVASYTNGSLYTWISEDGLLDNPATIIGTGPLNINAGIFTAMPEQQVIAVGASDGSDDTTDPMLVRWSDISDNTDWTATATNQAGSFRIPRGARLVGGLQGPTTAMLWTDVGLWLMQYIGFPLVYGFTEIGQGCGLLGQNAKGVLAGKVYWMSNNGFFVYDGNSVQALPCAVWDKVFRNIQPQQSAKIIACPNSFFNEISWCYPSGTGDGDTNENDSRVTYNAVDGTWTYDPQGAITRTTWLDQSSLYWPLGVDGNGFIQQHEAWPDNDDQPMISYAQTGFTKISNGLEYTFLERIIPDAILDSATLQFTFFFQNYPNGAVRTIGPLDYTTAKEWLIVRGRGRLVSVKIGSVDTGSFWRHGQTLEFGEASGRR